MTFFANLVVAGAMAIVATLAVAGSAEAKKCVLAGGEGSGVTKDVATYMANAALSQSMTKLGVKPAGKAKVSCTTGPLLVTTCTANQRACK